MSALYRLRRFVTPYPGSCVGRQAFDVYCILVVVPHSHSRSTVPAAPPHLTHPRPIRHHFAPIRSIHIHIHDERQAYIPFHVLTILFTTRSMMIFVDT
ncbi:hypothetical protein VTO73DRAFT_14175 [Trametes versicolor]